MFSKCFLLLCLLHLVLIVIYYCKPTCSKSDISFLCISFNTPHIKIRLYWKFDIRRQADKFCLHCNIFIHIRHIWIKPVLCSSTLSLFIILHLEHTGAYSSHPVHIEMEEFSDVRFKQHAVIEFLTAENVPPIEIHRWMQAIYGDQCVDVSRVRCWVKRFKDGELGQADLSDKTGRTDFKN